MEGRRRRSFTDDYKRQAAGLVASSGRSIGSVAKELGLRDSVLRRWVERRGAGREPTAAARRPITQAAPPSADQAAEIARLREENERLRMERDILKKSIAIFAGTPDMSFRFIEDHRDSYPVTSCAPCSRSRRQAITPGDRARRASGQRPIAGSSRRSGRSIGTTADVMAAHDPRRPESARTRRKPRADRANDAPARHSRHHGTACAGCARPTAVTTCRSHRTCSLAASPPRAEPGLARRYHLHPDRSRVAVPGRRHGSVQPQDRRLGDAGSLQTELPLAALRMAIQRSAGAGLIHHSDRGVQYASADYRKLLQSVGIKASMSRKADCYDNAPMESFFHTLKTELVHHPHYATRAEAQRDIFAYIEGFYNRTRLHSAIGYISPIQMELKAA